MSDTVNRADVLERLELAEHEAEERDWRSGANEIARLRKFVEALPAATGWQDISTAPRDGREVVGYRPDQGVFIFRWASMSEVVRRDHHGDPVEDYDEDFECWVHDAWGWMEGDLTPTHWQPLPGPPA